MTRESLFLSGFSQHADVVHSSFKVSFDRKTLTQFWLSVTNTYPTRSTTCIKSAVSFYYFLLVRNWIFTNE
ncbi:hypothetical protein T08_16610 [Trichinella sp. T8]|nr:hypothetical protein T08_16610 [Trichinella sp. T8]